MGCANLLFARRITEDGAARIMSRTSFNDVDDGDGGGGDGGEVLRFDMRSKTDRSQLSDHKTHNINRERQTRLPFNLRPTTRDCVHLVTSGHFRSRDKDGVHTIRSAIAENPMLHADFAARTGVIADESFTSRELGFWTMFAPVTLTLTR